MSILNIHPALFWSGVLLIIASVYYFVEYMAAREARQKEQDDE